MITFDSDSKQMSDCKFCKHLFYDYATDEWICSLGHNLVYTKNGDILPKECDDFENR